MADDKLNALVQSLIDKGESDDTIHEVLSQYKAAHTAPTPQTFWDQHPTVAHIARSALDALPGAGAIVGSALGGAAGLPTGPADLAIAAGAAGLGAGAGRGLRDLLTEGTGLEKPTTPTSKAVRIGVDTAGTAATDIAMPAIAGAIRHPLTTAGDALDATLHPRDTLQFAADALRGESAPAEPILTRPGWQAVPRNPAIAIDAPQNIPLAGFQNDLRQQLIRALSKGSADASSKLGDLDAAIAADKHVGTQTRTLNSAIGNRQAQDQLANSTARQTIADTLQQHLAGAGGAVDALPDLDAAIASEQKSGAGIRARATKSAQQMTAAEQRADLEQLGRGGSSMPAVAGPQTPQSTQDLVAAEVARLRARANQIAPASGIRVPLADAPVAPPGVPKVPINQVPASRSSGGLRAPFNPTLTVEDLKSLGINPSLKVTGLSPDAVQAITAGRASRAGLYRSSAELDAIQKALIDKDQ